MMDIDSIIAPRFWELVEASAGDRFAMEQILFQLSKDDLARFYLEFVRAKNHLDERVEEFLPERPSFLDIAGLAMLISRGKKYYSEIFANPQKLFDVRQEDLDSVYGFGALASSVYLRRFGTCILGYAEEEWPKS